METNQYFFNGKYQVATSAHEMKMSHWVHSPVIRETSSGKVILNLEFTAWGLRSVTESNERLVLILYRYPDGNSDYCVEVDPINRVVLISGEEYPLINIESTLELIV
ncbi:hypothetical protein [Vibrio neptunius]|uniref:hypothetical protein n=1 Tax=Vibrio neptunius TaxID=170651 RepID=UPI0019D16900|nr:hypothetical protein [Vibrio neptunius]MBN3575924.1 hypothetical protein [Vibrio neptunius]